MANNHYSTFISWCHQFSVRVFPDISGGECVNLDESCVSDVLDSHSHSRPGYHHIAQVLTPQGASVMVTQTGTMSPIIRRRIKCSRVGETRQFPSASAGCHNYVGISIIMSASGVGFLRCEGRAKLISHAPISPTLTPELLTASDPVIFNPSLRDKNNDQLLWFNLSSGGLLIKLLRETGQMCF